VQSVYNLTKALSKEAEFFICTSNTDLGHNEPLNVTSNKWLEFSENISVIYLSKERQTKRQFKTILTSREFHTIYFNSVFSYRFSILPLWISRNLQTKRIVASRGMLASGSLALKKSKKTMFLSLAKPLCLYKNVIWHVSAPHEALDVQRQFGPSSQTVVAPNLPNQDIKEQELKTKNENELDLFYLGRVAEVKNLFFALQCLNHSFTGTIRYHIYGPLEEEAYWQECQEEIKKLPKNILVTYHGKLTPNQIHSTISQHDALLLPTLNENYGHVIIESFLASKPVLISDQTPWLDLKEKQVGCELPLGSMEPWRKEIQCLLRLDSSAYAELSHSAYHYGKEVLNRKEDLEQNRALFLS